MTDLFLAPDAPRGLGAAMVGGGPKVARKAYDFYPTPPEVTRALLRVEGQCIANMAAGGPVWEPCGRGGAILRELQALGLPTVGSDLVADETHDVAPLDVLRAKRALSPVVVTNPPFALAPEIILHLLARLNVRYLALLLKASFFHAEERRAMFAAHRPARIHALTWRPDFLNKGAPTMECAWFVWQAGWALGTQYSLLPRDGGGQECLL